MSRKLRPEPKVTVAAKKPPRWQREKNITRFIWIFITLTIAVIAGLVGYWGYDNYVAAWQQPVVRVNETTLDMNYFVKMLRFYSRNPDVKVDPSALPSQVLTIIENNELVKQGAPGLDIYVTPDEVTDEIESLLLPTTEDGGNTTQPKVDTATLYEQWLDQIQFSDEEYRQLVETVLLRKKLTQYLQEQEVPTDAEQVHLGIIPVADEATASEVSDKLKSGGNFTELAKEYSIVNELQDSGGDAGWVPRGVYPELDDVIFTLEAGNVTEPIKTAKGYYIAQVSGKAESMSIPDNYRGILTIREFQDWIRAQTEASIIETYLDQSEIAWAVDQIS